MFGPSSSVIYEWPSSEGLLIPCLLPRAARIPAGVHDALEDVLARIPIGAGAFLFHIGATFTSRFPLCRPALLTALELRGIQAVNGPITDISKRTLQAHCRRLGLNTTTAGRDGDPEELLIVKTNMNYGGNDDRALSWRQRRSLGLPRITRAIRGTRDYKIVRRREVKAGWWEDQQLVVERYIHNRPNRIFKLYRARDRVAINDMINPQRIKKPSGSIRRVNSFFQTGENGLVTCVRSSEFPEQLVLDGLRLLDDIGMTYGTLDIALDDDGRWYIIDLNSTPTAPNKPQPDVVDYLRLAFA